jgi:hypothetical protein
LIPILGARRLPSCIWPIHGNRSGIRYWKQTVEGLAVYEEHARALIQKLGRLCAWPQRSEKVLFLPACAYHKKRVRRLTRLPSGPARRPAEPDTNVINP